MPINRDGIRGEKVVSGNYGTTFTHFEGRVTDNPDGSRTLAIRFDEVELVIFGDGTSFSRPASGYTSLDVVLSPPETEFFMYNLRNNTPRATKKPLGQLADELQSLYLHYAAARDAG